LNHTHRKPYIPLPPALPRFALPNEMGANEVDDPSDAAATQQRPAMSSVVGPRHRRVVRRKPAADSTEEVQVEDILLEAYAEEPPPPLTRRSASRPPAPSESARESIAMAIASAVPPPAQTAAVDALLRASDPAFAPYPPQTAPLPLQGQGFVTPQPYSYANPYPVNPAYQATGNDFESMSVVPVMMATTAPPPARPVFAAARANRINRAAVVAIWSSVLVVLGVALGAAVVLGVKNGTYARVRDGAKSAAMRSSSKPASAAAAAPAPSPAAAPAPPDTQIVAPAPPAPVAAPAAATPTVSVESLTPPPIPSDSSLVTFPAYAQGHRVFIDGRLIAVADGSPTKVKCGRHMVKIGSARKPRVLDFACGREVIVK
jgi:hypothetical protein